MTLQEDRLVDSGASTPVVSLLAGVVDDFYAALAGWLQQRGSARIAESGPGSFAARRRLALSGKPALVALCGGLYVRDRQHVDLRLVAAPAFEDAGDGRRPLYSADVIVHRRSEARAFSDLRGGVFVYNDTESLSGHDAVLDELRARGESSGFFRTAIASGEHRASIDMVTSGLADAASIDGTVLAAEVARRPSLAGELRVVHRLGPFPSPPLVVTGAVSESDRRAIAAALVTAHESPAGREVLARGRVSRFVHVEATDYDTIEQLVSRIQGVSLATGPRHNLRWTLAAGSP